MKFLISLFFAIAGCQSTPTETRAPAAAQGCELNLDFPHESSITRAGQVSINLDAAENLHASFKIEHVPSYKPALGPNEYPYMYDVVELFVATSSKGMPYYEFELSPAGETFQVLINPKFNNGVKLGMTGSAQVSEGGWTGEIVVPLKNLKGWSCNTNQLVGNAYAIVRLDEKVRTYWSAFPFTRPQTGANFHQPAFFRPLLKCQ